MNYSLIDSISSGVCIINEDYCVLVWNSQMEDLTGISGNKIFGQKLFEFFPDFFEESIQLRLEMVFSGGTPIVFSSLLHRRLFLGKDSEDVNKYFEVIANSFKLENGTVSLLFTVKDVTELNLQILKFREMRDKALAEVENG